MGGNRINGWEMQTTMPAEPALEKSCCAGFRISGFMASVPRVGVADVPGQRYETAGDGKDSDSRRRKVIVSRDYYNETLNEGSGGRGELAPLRGEAYE